MRGVNAGQQRIEIIGGGVAGLFLGILLRRAEVEVSIHEAGSYPRHRVCGEFVSGCGRRLLSEAGLASIFPEATVNHSVAWNIRGRQVLAHSLPEAALGVSRYVMDQRLAECFEELGGMLNPKTRVGPTEAEAEGVVSCAGRRLSREEGLTWLGLKVHALNYPLKADLEMHLGAGAYVGISRIEDGRANVCGLFRLRRGVVGKREGLLLRYLEASGLGKTASELLEANLDKASFVGVTGISFAAPKLEAPENSPRLGDAMAAIPPFTGNGMSIALECAAVAAPLLTQYSRGALSWVEAGEQIHAALYRRFRYRFFAARCLHPLLLHSGWQRLLGAIARCKLLPTRQIYRWTH